MTKIAIIGLGYVGLPLAVAFSKKYEVIGFDIKKSRIEELNNNYDRTLEVSKVELENIKKSIVYTNEINKLEDCNIYIVTVPTPVDINNKPDLSPLINSSSLIAKVLKKDDIVIYESTVYPGVTEEVCVPVLENNSNLKYNIDFFCGYSPERINPGDKTHTLKNIVKVTSGSDKKTAKKVDELYNTIIDAGTYSASSIKVAEASKVIENTQRDVNIALINELALIFDHMNIDTNEVIEAASTKWNFINLRPGLVGGHCIGVDPYYLTYKAEELGYKPNLILGARHINKGMGKFIVEKTIKHMIKKEIKIKNSNILVLGATFKENCPDMRNTGVIDIIESLKEYEISVDIYDPWVDINEKKERFNYTLLPYNPFSNEKKYDAILVAVAHNEFKKLTDKQYQDLLKSNSVLIDIKGILSNPDWRL